MCYKYKLNRPWQTIQTTKIQNLAYSILMFFLSAKTPPHFTVLPGNASRCFPTEVVIISRSLQFYTYFIRIAQNFLLSHRGNTFLFLSIFPRLLTHHQRNQGPVSWRVKISAVSHSVKVSKLDLSHAGKTSLFKVSLPVISWTMF